MKLTTANIAVIMVAIVGISAATTYAVTTELVDPFGKPTGNGAMMLTGNVKAMHIDGEGNVIGYRQSDNHIVGQGMEMIISQMFKGMNGTADADSQPVSHMEIGHSGEWELLMNDTNLRLPANVNVVGCDRVAAAFANVTNGQPGVGDGFGRDTIVTGVRPGGLHTPCEIGNWGGESGGADSATCAAQANVTAQADFLGTNCADAVLTIDEAAMFNSAAGGTMFARNNFGSVVLGAPDTLRLDWEFTFTDS